VNRNGRSCPRTGESLARADALGRLVAPVQYSEAQAYENAYENGAWLGSEEGTINLLAGSCVGGGTTINW
jgi:hypothetical protein